MKTSSAKAKGRRLQQQVRDAFLSKTWYVPHPVKLREGDVKSAIMGESGRDIHLSPAAEDVIPFDIECKNTETASPWAWMKQAKENTKPGRMPLVAFTRNREGDVYAMIRFEDLLKLL